MVRDTGPGIPEDFQEKIFDKFCQLETPLVKSSGGTGLGLSIVKWIVDHHQGRIWVEGREGEGSAFFLILPLMKK
jgi:NtrC-family two-component system sensor histidine kinase KinB